MPVFEYEVADRRGALTRGRAEAPNQGDLILRLRERGQLVVALRQAAPGALAGALEVGPLTEAVKQSYRRLSSGVSINTLVLFTGQLSAMLAGGLHLVRVLTALAADTTNKPFKAALEEVRDAVTAGSSFADALGQHPHIWSALYRAIVRAGELSGSLPQVLETLTLYLEKVVRAPPQGARRHRLPGGHPVGGAPDRVRHDRQGGAGVRGRVRPGQGRAARAHAPPAGGQRRRPRLHRAGRPRGGRAGCARLRGGAEPRRAVASSTPSSCGRPCSGRSCARPSSPAPAAPSPCSSTPASRSSRPWRRSPAWPATA